MNFLPNVTIVCIDCYNYGKAVLALQKCKEQVQAAKTILLTDIDKNLDPTINRITFLDEVLESSLISNEQEEEYIVCQVLFDCRKYLNIE